MPYITQEKRERVDKTLAKLENLIIFDAPMLAYCTLRLMDKSKGLSWAERTMQLGAVLSAAEEYKRLWINPYEDEKREENGDVS